MPRVAALASQIQEFKLPWRELRSRYTRSEMCMVAWRSSEIAYNMRRQMDRPVGKTTIQNQITERVDHDFDGVESQLGESIVRKLMKQEQEGKELALGALTGAEALHFLGTFGMTSGRA